MDTAALIESLHQNWVHVWNETTPSQTPSGAKPDATMRSTILTVLSMTLLPLGPVDQRVWDMPFTDPQVQTLARVVFDLQEAVLGAFDALPETLEDDDPFDAQDAQTVVQCLVACLVPIGKAVKMAEKSAQKDLHVGLLGLPQATRRRIKETFVVVAVTIALLAAGYNWLHRPRKTDALVRMWKMHHRFIIAGVVWVGKDLFPTLWRKLKLLWRKCCCRPALDPGQEKRRLSGRPQSGFRLTQRDSSKQMANWTLKQAVRSAGGTSGQAHTPRPQSTVSVRHVVQ